MKKKKLISIITGALLAVCAIGFVGCDEKGEKGDTGAAGAPGAAGKSAYEIWLAAGNTGSEADFLEWLKADAETVDCDHENLFTYALEEGATCMHGNEVLNVCNDCQSAWITYDENKDPANHEVDWVVTVPATCLEEGEQEIDCVCGYKATDVVKKLDHEYEKDEELSYDKTCTEDGYFVGYCINGCSGNAEDENYSPLHKKEEVLVHIGHQWKEDTPIIEDGINICEVEYQTATICTVCHEIKAGSVETQEARGHIVTSEWTSTVDPTLTTDGKLAGHCSYCDEDIELVLPKLNRTDYSYAVDNGKEATCLKDGEGKYTYEKGTFKETFVVVEPAYKHTNKNGLEMDIDYMNPNATVYTRADVDGTFGNAPETCVDASGLGRFVCQTCEEEYLVRLTGAHTLGAIITEKCEESTCYKAGKNVYDCTVCDQDAVVVLEKLAHNYKTELIYDTVNTDEVVGVEFTCTNAGCSATALDKNNEPGEYTIDCAGFAWLTADEYVVVSGDKVYPVSAAGWYTIVEDAPVAAEESTEGAIAAIAGKVSDTCQAAGYNYYWYTVEVNGGKVYGKVNGNVRKHYAFEDEADIKIADLTIAAELNYIYEWSKLAEAFGAVVEDEVNGDYYNGLNFFGNSPSTCVENGLGRFVCAGCAQEFLVYYTQDHKMERVGELVPATCTEKAYYNLECKNAGCDHTDKEEVGDDPDHVYEVININEVEDIAYITLKCKVCGDQPEVIEASEYHYEYVDTTCKNDGKKNIVYSYSYGGHTYADITKAVEVYPMNEQLHFWGDTPIYILGLTETAGGSIEIVYNGEVVEVEKKVWTASDLRAVFGDKYNVDDGSGLRLFLNASATCQVTGSASFLCESCEVAEEQLIYRLTGDHAWAADAYKTTPASCVKGEVKHYKCTIEGCTEENEVETPNTKLSHNYKIEVIAPATKVNPGKVKVTCPNGCATAVEIVVPAVPADELTGDDTESNGWTVVTDDKATCQNGGIKVYNYTVAYDADEDRVAEAMKVVSYTETEAKKPHNKLDQLLEWRDDEGNCCTGYLCQGDNVDSPEDDHLIIASKHETVAQPEELETWSDDAYDYTGWTCNGHKIIVSKTEKVVEAA